MIKLCLTPSNLCNQDTSLFPRMLRVTALPSPRASPDHREQPSAPASIVHKSLRLQQRRKETSDGPKTHTRDVLLPTNTTAMKMLSHTSPITRCTHTHLLPGALPNLTHTHGDSTQHPLPPAHIHNHTHTMNRDAKDRSDTIKLPAGRKANTFLL